MRSRDDRRKYHLHHIVIRRFMILQGCNATISRASKTSFQGLALGRRLGVFYGSCSVTVTESNAGLPLLAGCLCRQKNCPATGKIHSLKLELGRAQPPNDTCFVCSYRTPSSGRHLKEAADMASGDEIPGGASSSFTKSGNACE